MVYVFSFMFLGYIYLGYIPCMLRQDNLSVLHNLGIRALLGMHATSLEVGSKI